MHTTLIAIVNRTNQTKNMDRGLSLYTQVLNTVNLNSYLSKKEIADTYYNRSLNHIEVANFYWTHEKDYSNIHYHLRMALSDIRNAQIRYPDEGSKQVCADRIGEYNNMRLIVINAREAEPPAWVTHFFPANTAEADLNDSISIEPFNRIRM